MRKILGVVLWGGCLLLPGAVSAGGAERSARKVPNIEDKAFRVALREKRQSPLDLEINGDMGGAAGITRYVSREDLLKLPQVAYTVTDDANLKRATAISGVLLEELRGSLPVPESADVMVAICIDQYHAHFPADYVAAHHPILVLKINGKGPNEWLRDTEGHTAYVGPYLITHAKFTSSFKILAHEDEPQIPWGVVRLEFREKEKVFGAIAPRGPEAADASVQAGFRIAKQNCFRCHDAGGEGGTKAGIPWPVLTGWAAAAPERFAAYVRDPQASNPKTQMAASPQYDDATMKALIEYFKTFANRGKP